MITAELIIPFRFSSDDYALTEQIKSHFAQVRQERHPSSYLTLAEFDEALHWKLRGQYERQRKWRQSNTDDVIRTVTGIALSVAHSDPDYEIELRVGILCALRGVGVPVASAVLALVFPEEYAVIDFRGWRQVFDELKSTFSIADYKRYMREIRALAIELGWLPQEVDLAIWEYDRVKGWSFNMEIANINNYSRL
ncbi:MAG: hypothetical protein AB1435_01750 [Chloroflexota bacterium]|jgi:hypothetical protein